MRLKQDLSAPESRLNLRNSSLQDKNRNCPVSPVLDSTTWDTYHTQRHQNYQLNDFTETHAPVSDVVSQNYQTGDNYVFEYKNCDNFCNQTKSSSNLQVDNQPKRPSSLTEDLLPDNRSLTDSDDTGCSSSDISPDSGPPVVGNEYRTFQDDLTDSDCEPTSVVSSPSLSPRSTSKTGILNPNYPGFQHIASKLLRLAAGSDDESERERDVNESFHKEESEVNNNVFPTDEDEEALDDVNQLGPADADTKKDLYDKPKLSLTMADAFLSSAKEDLTLGLEFVQKSLSTNMHSQQSLKQGSGGFGVKQSLPVAQPQPQSPRHPVPTHKYKDSNRAADEMEHIEKFNKESSEKESDECVVPRKKEKMALNHHARKARLSAGMFPLDRTSTQGRRSQPASGNKQKRSSLEILGGFDVYNIETAMPKIDLDLIESHLKAAKEEERRRRNDREEIRRRLAMGSEDGDYYAGEKSGRKPSLQARLQSGMNLQICFMNETLSDTESPGSEGDAVAVSNTLNADSFSTGSTPMVGASTPVASPSANSTANSLLSIQNGAIAKPARPLSLPLRLDKDKKWREEASSLTEADFLARQAQLQADARVALAQAKDMAHMQMEVERQKQNASPITEMVRHSLQKVGVSFPPDRRRLSRQILTEMNVAQLQVIVNDFHTQIEYLNESLVQFLMERDDLHMEQDSMLVDIEDLTRYLGAKEQCSKAGLNQNNNVISSSGSAVTVSTSRLTVKK